MVFLSYSLIILLCTASLAKTEQTNASIEYDLLFLIFICISWYHHQPSGCGVFGVEYVIIACYFELINFLTTSNTRLVLTITTLSVFKRLKVASVWLFSTCLLEIECWNMINSVHYYVCTYVHLCLWERIHETVIEIMRYAIEPNKVPLSNIIYELFDIFDVSAFLWFVMDKHLSWLYSCIIRNYVSLLYTNKMDEANIHV